MAIPTMADCTALGTITSLPGFKSPRSFLSRLSSSHVLTAWCGRDPSSLLPRRGAEGGELPRLVQQVWSYLGGKHVGAAHHCVTPHRCPAPCCAHHAWVPVT